MGVHVLCPSLEPHAAGQGEQVEEVAPQREEGPDQPEGQELERQLEGLLVLEVLQ